MDRDSNVGPPDLQISSLELHHPSFSGSTDGTGLNLPLESNAVQGVAVRDAIRHPWTDELSSS